MSRGRGYGLIINHHISVSRRENIKHITQTKINEDDNFICSKPK